jgi:hypothetical protein
MKRAFPKTTKLYLAAVMAAGYLSALTQFAAANNITGTNNWQIVARLTGSTGSNSINPTWEVGVQGTDLGHTVNHNGKTYFLFGDTFDAEGTAGSGGPDWRYNVMAYSTDFNPANGITFDGWITRPDGTAKQMVFPGAEPNIPGFQPITYIPTGAISVGDKIYAWSMRVDWDGFSGVPGDDWMIGYAGLARWREGDSQFTNVPGFRFEAPDGGPYTWGNGAHGPGNFGMVAASYRSPLENANDPHIYLWGTPGGRRGGVKLARVMPADIENLAAYEFFDGLVNGAPQWVGNEFDAEKVIANNVGEMSVMYNNELRAWTLMYQNGANGNFEIRYSDTPWGEWSAPLTVTNFSQAPGLYAPYMNPLLVEDNGKTLYFTMSLWDPYDVYLAKVTLDIDYSTRWTGNIGAFALGSNWSHGKPTAAHYATLDNGGRIHINTTESVKAIDIGTGNGLGGTIQVSGAGALTVHAGGFNLGQGPGSNGALTMTSGSVNVLDTTKLFTVGDHGIATATISGGSITAHTFSIAHQPTALGHVELSGDAVIDVTGNRFQMGRLRNTTTGERPIASLTMTGGTINVNAGGGGASLPDFVAGWEGVAVIEMSGGMINVANNFNAAAASASGLAPASQATITHSGGTINIGDMTLGERGISEYTLSGTGQIDARGLMRLGRFSGSQSTFTQQGGTVNVALDNPSSIFIGLKIGEGGQATYSINGGALNVPGRLWVADLSSSTGQMNINGGSVTVGDLVRVRSTGTLNLDGGTLTVAAIQHNEGGTFNYTGGTLHVGTFTGNLTNTGGTLAPGSSAGTTNITGTYTQEAAATLAIEIGGPSPGSQHDRVNITGNATLGGELQLALVSGFVPSASETFTILSAAGLSGTFNNVATGQRLIVIDGSGSFLVHYGPESSFDQNQIVLADFQLTGDFNRDGIVDAADYVVWRRGLADGTMEPEDYDAWTANFGAPAAGAGAASSALREAVPEPSSLILLLLAVLAVGFRRRCKQGDSQPAAMSMSS